MPNAYANKVQVVRGGQTETLIDLTADTITASALMQGYTAHDASGAPITGTATGGSMVIRDEADPHGGTIRHITAGTVVTGTIPITENGSYDVAQYADAVVTVQAPAPSLQSKTATPTESQQTVTPDQGYDGLSSVSVGAISSTYVGSGITRRDSSSLSASGATVTVPSGYYAAQASKAVASGTVTAPSTISGSSATVSTGTNTLTLSKTVSVTPTVSTAGYVSSGTVGNSSVSLTASVTTKGAATITPTTTNQTISPGTYLTGTQTIAGDANLVAGNIKQGTSIFGVAGSYAGGGGGDSWSWIGKNPTLVDTLNDETLTFADLGVDNWTWGTGANTLRLYQSLSPSVTLNLSDYDYCLVINSYVHYDYGNWTPAAAITESATLMRYFYYGACNNLSAMENAAPNSSTSVQLNTTPSTVYYYMNSYGVKTYGGSTSYGVTMGSNMNVTVTNTNTASPTYTFSNQTISIRGNNTYFSSTAFSHLDFDKSYVRAVYELWRVDRGTTPYSKIYGDASQILNNGLS